MGERADDIRVLVVDDTLLQRRLVTSVLSAEAGIDVVGAAVDGVEGLEMIAALKPAVVILDVEMPRLDGLGVLRELRVRGTAVPVVIYSTLSERGAAVTFEALSLGASDYALKPHGAVNRDAALAQVRSELVPRVRALGRPRPVRPAPVGATLPSPRPAPDVPRTPRRLTAVPPVTVARPARPVPATTETRPAAARIGVAPVTPVRRPRASRPAYGSVTGVVIASSTGGPDALVQVVTALPADLAVPVVIVQHMPPTFTRMMAERFDSMSGLRVAEAEEGALVMAGDVWIAQGGRHLRLEDGPGAARLRLDDGPLVQSVRPSADILFESAVSVWGAGTLGVVLTGMGADGRDGCRAIAAAGGSVIAQDAATSVVWGMPGAVVEAGLADAVLPLPAIADAVVSRVNASLRKRVSR